MLGKKNGKKVPDQLLKDISTWMGPKATKNWMTVNKEAVTFQRRQHVAWRELQKTVKFAFCWLLNQKMFYYEVMFSSTPMEENQPYVTIAITLDRVGAKRGFHVLLKGESPPPIEKNGRMIHSVLEFKYLISLEESAKLMSLIDWVMKNYGKKINQQKNIENDHLGYAMQLYEKQGRTPMDCLSSTFKDCEWLQEMKNDVRLLMGRYAS